MEKVVSKFVEYRYSNLGSKKVVRKFGGIPYTTGLVSAKHKHNNISIVSALLG